MLTDNTLQHAAVAHAGADTRHDSPSEFIPIVDSLRAIAIALVVLYHVWPSLVPGGYVGVDVFFVISGYLILGHAARDLQQGNFSLTRFFKRRILRILPPYLLVMILTGAIASAVLVTPQELSDFLRDFQAASLMIANVSAAGLGGYFDSGAGGHVLLHLWSLSVEEQFYLIAPLLLLALFGVARLFPASRRPGAVAAVVGAIGLVSLAACGFWTADHNREAFYLMPYRGWEFILGGGINLAIPILRRSTRWFADGAIAVGLAAIGWAAASQAPELGYPSWYALAPTIGASLVIAGGASNARVLVPVLTLKPVLLLGLISYETYLWHWPVLVLARYAWFGNLPFLVSVACIVASVALAAVTHFALRGLIRRLRVRDSDRARFAQIVGGLACYGLVAISGYAAFSQVVSWVSASMPATLLPASVDHDTCDLLDPPSMQTCVQLNANRPFGLVLGDSHAGTNYASLARVAEAHSTGLVFAALSGCSPFFDVARTNDLSAMNCIPKRGRITQLLYERLIHPAYAILTAQWAFHDYTLIGPSQEATFEGGLSDDIGLLQYAGAQRILILGAPPIFPGDPVDCVLRSDRMGLSRDERCAVSAIAYRKRVANLNGWIRSVIGGRLDVRLVDPATVFCDESLCRPFSGNVMRFRDFDHLSDAGATAVATFAADDLAWVMGSP